MRNKLTSNTVLLALAGFVMGLLLILVGVAIGLGFAYNELARTLQQTHVDPSTYQLQAARSIGILMQSQCFNATDACCEYTDELLQHIGEAMTLESHHHYLADGLARLMNSGCVVTTEDCTTFAVSVIMPPVKQSSPSHPLPHEGK